MISKERKEPVYKLRKVQYISNNLVDDWLCYTILRWIKCNWICFFCHQSPKIRKKYPYRHMTAKEIVLKLVITSDWTTREIFFCCYVYIYLCCLKLLVVATKKAGMTAAAATLIQIFTSHRIFHWIAIVVTISPIPHVLFSLAVYDHFAFYICCPFVWWCLFFSVFYVGMCSLLFVISTN